MDSLIVAHLVSKQQSDFQIIKEMLTASEGVVLFVLIALIVFSIVCWGIILIKWLQIQKAQRQSLDFLDIFWEVKDLGRVYQETEELQRSPLAQVFRAGAQELDKVQRSNAQVSTSSKSSFALGGIENVERAMRRASNEEMANLERYVPFLATTASAAPFVGLFGTVWGIMKSFIEIKAKGSAGLTVVAPGIAEALIATAVGLAAAIPAVIAYNFFNAKINALETEMENFGNDFLNIVKRHFLK